MVVGSEIVAVQQQHFAHSHPVVHVVFLFFGLSSYPGSELCDPAYLPSVVKVHLTHRILDVMSSSRRSVHPWDNLRMVN